MSGGFQYGVNTLLFSEAFGPRDVRYLYDIRRIGFDAVDIAVPALEGFPAQAVKNALRETGLRAVLNFNMPLEANPISEDSENRRRAAETIRGVIDLANDCGAEMVSGVLCAGYCHKTGRQRTRREWDWSVAHMRQAADYAARTGTAVLAFEVINRYLTHFINTAADAARYCRDVGRDNVKIHLDSFHMMVEETSFREAISVCGKERLGYFHACENQRGIPGSGLVPWEELYSALRDIGYTGLLSLESYDPSFTRVASRGCMWRRMAASGEEFAVEGLRFLRDMERKTERKEHANG